MAFTGLQLAHDIETLRHGGREAISRFMEISERLYDEGGADALQSWVTIAAPVLPELERIEVVTMLLRELFDGADFGEMELSEDGETPRTLN